MIRTFSVSIALLGLSACGTFTPIPSHGGGKRFAVEQALVSACMRQSINDLPVESLQNKRILLDTTVIHDEGGGALTGGRPYLNEFVTAQRQLSRTSAGSELVTNNQSIVGVASNRSDTLYVKDVSFNNSDAKQFSNLLASFLVRQNIMLNPNAETEGEPDYFLEVIVDVFGTWRSRKDWGFTNDEQLRAIVSLEYVITPLRNDLEKRKTGRISYEAGYTEKYIGWMGPQSTETYIKKSDLAAFIPVFGEGNNVFSNLKRNKPIEFSPPDPSQAPQINPRLK